MDVRVRVWLAGLVTAVFAAASVASADVHEKAGTTGMSFLKVGVGGRASAMAGAYTAISGDQTCSYWNPAGLIGPYRQSGTLMHCRWFQGIRYEYGGWAARRGADAWGLAFTFNSSGEIELRDRPTLEPSGTSSVYDLALTFSYARELGSLCLGASGKVLYEKIYTEDASGVALDLGVLYHLPVRGLSVGSVLRNLGRMNAMKDEAVRLPVAWQAGAAFVLPLSGPLSAVLFAVDVRVPNDFWTSVHGGVELRFRHPLALRAGYQTGAEEHNIAAGFGIRKGALQLDYAYVPYYFDLGDTHRISLGWRIGR